MLKDLISCEIKVYTNIIKYHRPTPLLLVSSAIIFHPSTMSSKPAFLTVPLELRHQIYSHLLINDAVVKIASGAMVKSLRNGIIRSCWQTFHEMLEYYYANNTFLLSLLSPLESTPSLLKHLGRMQHLQVEIGDLVLSPTHTAFFLHRHTQRRSEWFLNTLRQAKRGQEGRYLKTLVAIDRCGTSIVSE